MLSERAQGLHRLAGPVQDHIRGIEIDPQVRSVHRVQELQQRRRRLLSGFQREGLAVAGAMVADAAHEFEDGPVLGIARIFGQAADVRCHAGNAERASEIRHRVGPLLALAACRRGHVAHGLRANRDARVALALEALESCDDLKLGTVQRGPPTLGCAGSQVRRAMHAQLSAAHAECGYGLDDLVGGGVDAEHAAGPEHQADLQWFHISRLR